ncbi:MAG: hypothetical protein IJL05_04455 [Alphaproteobacteria bacterium]|nr:hypothetical protein [Alphaproteobacteria bacterium]
MTTEKIEHFVKKLKTRKYKNIIYVIFICFIVGIFALRFYTVAMERNRKVFNIARNNIANGTPVHVLEMHETDGVLYEPLNIKNNRAYVSGARVKMFNVGQSLGDCKIISVSNNIDLDSGMYIIKTKKCSDGLKYAQNKQYGFFVPLSAVSGNAVYVVNAGVANVRKIEIVSRDSQNVLVKSGLENGDMVILSDVRNNEKIQIVK